MNEIKTKTIGQAWTGACKYIFEKGVPMKDEDQDIRELLHFVLTIEEPKQQDPLVEKYGDKEMIAWMMSNFFDQKKVPELKNADSYGIRLFNYNGKNQIEWVIDKLKKKPEAKSVTIPTLMPNQDQGYIPCVSMLDFKIRDNKLMLVAMCRSIDFGKKVYANMLALNKIQEDVSKAVGTKVGPLVMYVVSAHIYDDDYKNVEGILNDIRSTD